MKDLLKVALLVLTLLSATALQAQVKFGPTAGLNLSTMTLKSAGLSIDPKTLAGFNVGVLSEFNLKGDLYLQPALLFTSKGSGFSVFEEEMTITPAFVEVPVNAVYKIGKGSTRFFLETGPYFAFGIAGKVKSGGESADISWGSGDSDNLKPFDYGLNFGAGIELGSIIISAHYELGLANLYPVSADDAEAKTRVTGVSVSYMFGGK